VHVTTFTSICDDADNQLFDRITGNSQHLLHPLLPPELEQHYSLRERSHNYQLPGRATAVNDKNFIMRMLYKDVTFNDSLLLYLFFTVVQLSAFVCHFVTILMNNE